MAKALREFLGATPVWVSWFAFAVVLILDIGDHAGRLLFLAYLLPLYIVARSRSLTPTERHTEARRFRFAVIAAVWLAILIRLAIVSWHGESLGPWRDWVPRRIYFTGFLEFFYWMLMASAKTGSVIYGLEARTRQMEQKLESLVAKCREKE